MRTRYLPRMTEIKTRNEVDILRTMFAREGIAFTHERGWNELGEHVAVHQYHLGKELNKSITWDEAVFSWYENVFTPLMRAIDMWEVRVAFPRQQLGDLFLAVSDHWLFLKERDPLVSPETAAHSFVIHYGKGFAAFFSRFLLAPGR